MRAARQLVDWSAEQLAKRCGLTKDLILKYERGDSRPLAKSVEKVLRAFNDAGVVFVGDTGVNLTGLDFRILTGKDCYLRLLDEVCHALSGKKNLEALFICVDDAMSPPEVVEATKKIYDAGISCRFLAREDARRFDCPLEDYRLIPNEYYENSVMVIYDDTVATLRGTNDAVLIVRDSDNAKMLRSLFELIWAGAAAPDKKRFKP